MVEGMWVNVENCDQVEICVGTQFGGAIVLMVQARHAGQAIGPAWAIPAEAAHDLIALIELQFAEAGSLASPAN